MPFHGIKMPPVVDTISNAAEPSGVSVFIPTWAKVVAVNKRADRSVR